MVPMQNVTEMETCHDADITDWKPCFGQMTEPTCITMVVQTYQHSNLGRGEVLMWHL